MDLIETLYRSHYGRMSGKDKVARTLSLFDEVHSIIRRKILSQYPDLKKKDIQKKIAEVLYRTDSTTQHLLSLSDQ